jgi:hypothetical protein
MELRPGPKQAFTPADQADYTGIETNEKIVVALKEGLSLAQNLCTELEMNPSTSCRARERVWWDTPWVTENMGSAFGGWCDVKVEDLTPLEDEADQDERENVEEVTATPSQSQVEEEMEVTSVQDVDVQAGVKAIMDEMYVDLVYGEVVLDYKPTVTSDGKTFYKRTILSHAFENPGISKDRLLRVKQGVYHNIALDKPKGQGDEQTMMMTVGSFCGVLFEDPSYLRGRVTRGS